MMRRERATVHGVGQRSAAADDGTVPGPAAVLFLTEPARGLTEMALAPLAAPWLATAPRGDGHAVIVLPGFMGGDFSTSTLRRYLRRLGYDARGWTLGRNLGPTERVLDELPRLVTARAAATGGPVSLIGWSLGGVYARELARMEPAAVRQVITLGSPFALTDPRRQSRADGPYRRRAHLHAGPDRVPTAEQVSQPIPVPSTAVYSRRDGIVAWQACIEPVSDRHDNVEVRCSHLGFGVDPATLWLIADRLALPPGPQPRFRPPARQRCLYPRRP
jgi:pimeloyl-ACP methyl ester carboxylesterase